MPSFEVLPVAEAMLKSATGKRAEIAREYTAFIDKLEPGQAGRLQPSEGETISAVRRRLGAAGKMSGKQLTIRRVGNELLFWTSAQEGKPVRRRRRANTKGA